MRKLKLLLLNTQMEPAGIQKDMLILARGLQQRGHAVTVATMYDKGDYVESFSRTYGVEIVDLRMKHPGQSSPFRHPADLVGGLLRLWKLVRAGNFDVAQTFAPHSNTIGVFLAYAAGVPVRISAQCNALWNWPAWFLWLDRWLTNSSLVTRMVAVSEGTLRFCTTVEKMHPEKLVCIPNCIDTAAFSREAVSAGATAGLTHELGLRPDSFKITTVARLDPQKGHHYLLDAVPEIRRAIPKAEFLFVGTGSLRQELSERVDAMGLTGVVHLIGVRSDVRELLAMSDLFVLSSLWEGLPLSLLEAMAMELPVVVTDVDGSSEAVSDGNTGCLVPPRDSQALAAAICRLYEQPELRRQMAAAARNAVVERYSEPAFIDAFERLYATYLPSAEVGS